MRADLPKAEHTRMSNEKLVEKKEKGRKDRSVGNPLCRGNDTYAMLSSMWMHVARRFFPQQNYTSQKHDDLF